MPWHLPDDFNKLPITWPWHKMEKHHVMPNSQYQGSHRRLWRGNWVLKLFSASGHWGWELSSPPRKMTSFWYLTMSHWSHCFFFFFNGCTHSIWKFPGQGLNLSCSCYNMASFNPLCWARDWTRASTVTWAAAVRFLIPLCHSSNYKTLPVFLGIHSIHRYVE